MHRLKSDVREAIRDRGLCLQSLASTCGAVMRILLGFVCSLSKCRRLRGLYLAAAAAGCVSIYMERVIYT